MTPQEFEKRINQQRKAIARAFVRELPIRVGNIAQSHFKDNFRRGGFVNGGLKRWKPSKRIGRAKGAAGKYSTLLSSRNFLYNSITYKPSPGKVVISSYAPYAAVHNEGLRAGRGKGFQMPKRQFIGDSKELTEKVTQTIETTINKIIDL